MKLIDTHCHIQSVGLDKGEVTTRSLWAKAPELSAASVVDGAHLAGVEQMICVGCDLADSILAVDFVQDYSSCFASIGLHPHEADHYAQQPDKLSEFSGLASRPKVVAIGECGLDYFYNHSLKENQMTVLKFQLELALKSNLPVIFHVREAYDDFWPIFEYYPGIRGVLHSFTDSAENLQRALQHGLYIGVNGIATFAKNPEQIAMYKEIPLDHLVLETDAPFLAPLPFRGKVCKPEYVAQTAKFLASLRGEDQQLLARATTSNAHQLFNLSEQRP
jgi:TatD DNase family protein